MLSKLVIWLLSPLGMSLCLAGLALLLAWRRRLRSSMALGTLAFVWLWAWSMPVLSHWLGSVLENQYPQAPIASFEPAQAIVVLGGGIAPLVLVSGGSDPERNAYSEARASAIFLADLGVPAQAMALFATQGLQATAAIQAAIGNGAISIEMSLALNFSASRRSYGDLDYVGILLSGRA